MAYVGIDLHRKRSHVAVVGEDGSQRLSRRLVNDRDVFRELVGELGPDAAFALEATYGSKWLAELLEDAGCELHLAHPAPATTPTRGHDVAVVTTRHGAPGTFLVGGQGRALHLWDADHGKTTTCTRACAQASPPLTTKGRPKASGSAKSALLGTTKRSDGTLEVTYAGRPLYLYAADSTAGQISGQGSDGFAAPWWIVRPSGRAITP